MAITFQTIKELQERIANDLILAVNSSQLDATKQIDPNIRNSGIKGLVNSMAAGFDENNDLCKEVLKQLFPQTATGTYLELWAGFFGITRKEAVKAAGNIVFTGTAGTSIEAGTLIQKADETQFETLTTKSIAEYTVNVSSVTRSGTTATVTTIEPHNLATGVSVTIAGADQSAYNITAIVTVTSSTTFTYTVSGSPTTPATGTITATFIIASIDVIASDYGSGGNSSGGSQFTLVSPISGVDNTCILDYDGLAGGLDLEEDETLRTRLLERTANFTAPFSKSGLPVFIKEKVAGVTRIWVQDATPSAGYVTIYFTRDNDDNIIPTATQRVTVKNAIIDEDTGIKPANTPDNYVVVSSPTALAVDFTFSSLSPNTLSMRDAITTTLKDYFKSAAVNLETDITINEYNSLLYQVIDEDGNSPTFTLSSPSADIEPSTGELPVLGTITFPSS